MFIDSSHFVWLFNYFPWFFVCLPGRVLMNILPKMGQPPNHWAILSERPRQARRNSPAPTNQSRCCALRLRTQTSKKWNHGELLWFTMVKWRIWLYNWWLMEHDMVIYGAKVMFNAKKLTVLLRLICIWTQNIIKLKLVQFISSITITDIELKWVDGESVNHTLKSFQ